MKKVNAAILSFGMSGRVFHAPFLELHPGFELVGAWERSKDEFRKHYPNGKKYDSLESLLADENIELVVVNTPTYSHYEYVKLALEAGKHVVCEKAFTTTVAEAEELKELAEKKKLKLAVYQNRRWDSDFRTVRDVLQRGVLGDPVDVSFCFDRYAPELSPKQHKEVPGPGAGIVKDLGPHVIDQAIYQFGFPDALFAKISTTRETSVVDDYFKILLFYPTFTVQLRGGYFFKHPTPSFIVHGTMGSFLKTRADVQEPQLLKGIKPDADDYGIEPEGEFGLLEYVKEDQDIKEEVKALPGDYKMYYEGVYQAIANDQELPVSAEDGVRVMKIIEAAFQSNLEKRVVELA